MIFRAQSLKAPQRLAQLSNPGRSASPAYVKGNISRSGSMLDLQRLHTSETCAVRQKSEQSESSFHVEPAATPDQGSERSGQQGAIFTAAVFSVGLLLVGGPAYAAYDKSAGDQLFKNLAGGAYVLLVCFFFYRLYRRRASSGTTQSLRSKFQESIQDEMKAKDAEKEEKPVTPAGALWGAVQAGTICFLLFQVCSLVDGYFADQQMPDQYTARNITVTLRTIVRGLSYLITFLFGVNCVGLSGLAVQLLFFPETVDDSNPEDKAQS